MRIPAVWVANLIMELEAVAPARTDVDPFLRHSGRRDGHCSDVFGTTTAGTAVHGR